jgi:hypothetical protein
MVKEGEKIKENDAWYIGTTVVNGTMYPQYNNHMIMKKKRRQELGKIDSLYIMEKFNFVRKFGNLWLSSDFSWLCGCLLCELPTVGMVLIHLILFILH